MCDMCELLLEVHHNVEFEGQTQNVTNSYRKQTTHEQYCYLHFVGQLERVSL
jgi:hypothetical protein